MISKGSKWIVPLLKLAVMFLIFAVVYLQWNYFSNCRKEVLFIYSKKLILVIKVLMFSRNLDNSFSSEVSDGKSVTLAREAIFVLFLRTHSTNSVSKAY